MDTLGSLEALPEINVKTLQSAFFSKFKQQTDLFLIVFISAQTYILIILPNPVQQAQVSLFPFQLLVLFHLVHQHLVELYFVVDR